MGSVPIALVTGPANAGKARLVLEAVMAHAAHGEPPLLVVPTEADQARYRRELAERGLALGVRVERFEGLLREVLVRARETSKPLSALARERLLGQIAGVRAGTAAELAKLVADLETQRVTPARLSGAVRAWGTGGETLAWVCRAFERYRAVLTSIGRADRELRVTSALDALRRYPASWGATPVALYGFDDFTPLQLDTIETLAGVVDARVTLSLPYEPGRVVFAGRASTFQRLAPLADAHTQLPARADYYEPKARAALHHLERSLFVGGCDRVDPGRTVRLLEGGSPRAELELVAGEIRALLDDGVEPGEIAIVHRTPETIAALLGEVLADFNVPHGQRTRTLFARTTLGRALLGVLRCALGVGELGDLTVWLRTPGVLEQPGLADGLEMSARTQGISDAAGARVLWEAQHWPLDRVERLSVAAERGFAALVDVLAAELNRLFAAPRAGSASVLAGPELGEATALTVSRRVLDELRELARVAPALAATPADVLEILERLELPPVSGQAGLTGEGIVAVVDPLSIRARRVRMVFACGLQEGVFPAPATPHPLLGEDQRRGLAAASGLTLHGAVDPLAAERYLLYALVSRPRERLTLSWHSADEDGAPVARSLFVDDVRDLLSPVLGERLVRRYAGASDWPGPGMRTGTFAERTLSVGVGPAGLVPPPIQPLGDERVLDDLRARPLWSASSLETWTSCPVKWFVERFLRAGEIDPRPEPIARGGLAHAALKTTLERLRERTGSARLTPASLGLAKRLLAEALAEHEPHHPLSVAPERLPGARRRLKVDLERYLQCAAEQAGPLEPTHLELEFGFDQDGLPALDLGEGVRLRGRIDRVDIGGEQAVIYDYKGSSAPPAARWIADGSFQVALYMRATHQLLGREPVAGFYQPLAGREIRARGVLDADSGLELDSVRTDRLTHEEVRELIERCVDVARQAAIEARSGALVPRPDTCAYNGGCAYPTICRCER
jgi:ATP-dependent helicase/DNAse subunit B